MSEQALMSRIEGTPNNSSSRFTTPPGSELLKFKQENGIPVSDNEKAEYNDNLGEQAKEMIFKIKTRLEEVRVELKDLRVLNKNIKEPDQKQANISRIISLSTEQDELFKEQESIVAEMLRLGFND
jgi:hypothetical protein